MSLEIQASVYNDKGRVRGNNEDNFYLNGLSLKRGALDDGASLSTSCGDDYQVYAVCDGMGGTDAGEEASLRTVQELSKALRAQGELSDPEKLKELLRSISESIYCESVRKERKSGTTIAMIVFSGGCATIVNVGDSRVYRFRDGCLQQLSLDHSKVQRLISMGLLTKEEVKTHPERHVITQFLGMPSDVKVSPYFSIEKEPREGDIWLICSDGLTDMVDDKEMERMMSGKTPADIAKQLMTTALARGGHDNVTVMVLKTVKSSGIAGRKLPVSHRDAKRAKKAEAHEDKTIEYPDQRIAAAASSQHGSTGKNKWIRTALTIVQYILEAVFLAVVIDLIYYLMT